MKLSIVIPAYNEEGSIAETIITIYDKLSNENIEHEIVIINDNSKDNTECIVANMLSQIPTLTVYTNPGPNGFGFAIRYGLEKYSGDCVAIMMADLSDSPDDLITYYKRLLEKNTDCVFGSRFIRGGNTYDYPPVKLIINRIANFIIQSMIGMRYNDTTNAFKLYKRHTIDGIKPFLSPHFNLTIEMPLKAIVRGYSYSVVPNSWRNRKTGTSKLKIREMGSRYLFILLYVLIERFFSKGDFKKKW